jgi:hypothetical protein
MGENMKNITFRIEDDLLMRAKEKARKERKSLNSIFQTWLKEWTGQNKQAYDYDKLMDRLNEICESGGTFSRDELNER